MSSSSDAYASFLAQLYGRTNAGIKLELTAVRAALDRLGSPDERMQHVVVAGTNGKGSTSALIASALDAAGVRVGHFSSPHLLRFTERFRVNSREIDGAHAMELARRVSAVEPGLPRPLSFFEVTTCIALLAFAEARAEVAVLEVGLGGRLDATNAVGDRLAVITPIGIDHTQYLGDTLEQIAFEKAGVIGRGGVVTAPQEDVALRVIRQRAKEVGAELVEVTHPGGRGGEPITLPCLPGLVIETPPPGAYQRINVAVAGRAFAATRWASSAAFAAAVTRLHWPGRFEWIGDEVLIDGAHNPHGLRALLAALEEDARSAGRPMHLVFTALSDKPLAEMARLLTPRAGTVHVVGVRSARARAPEDLAAHFPDAVMHADVAAALARATLEARASGGFVLVAGSLFLAADALHLLTGARRDPPVDG